MARDKRPRKPATAPTARCQDIFGDGSLLIYGRPVDLGERSPSQWAFQRYHKLLHENLGNALRFRTFDDNTARPRGNFYRFLRSAIQNFFETEQYFSTGAEPGDAACLIRDKIQLQQIVVQVSIETGRDAESLWNEAGRSWLDDSWDWLAIDEIAAREDREMALEACADYQKTNNPEPTVTITAEQRDSFSRSGSGGDPPTAPRWRFEGSRFAFDGQWYRLTPTPLRLLRLMVTNIDRQTFDEEFLIQAWDDPPFGRTEAVRNQMKILRGVLRKVAKSSSADAKVCENPLPNERRFGWRFELPRH